jgi:hypothetical protein
MRKRDILIGNQGRVVQIGVYQVLNFTVVKKINSHNPVVLVFHSNHDEGVISRIAIGKSTDMFKKLGFPLPFAYTDKALFIIKTVLVIVGEQVFYQ